MFEALQNHTKDGFPESAGKRRVSMPKGFSVLAVIFCGLWSASQPVFGASLCAAISPNLVTNCGFETGDFTGWTTGGNALNPGGNYYGVDAFDANSGNFGAYLSRSEERRLGQ